MKNYVCGSCDVYFDTKRGAIKHAQRVHSDDPECCYDQYGDTWDDVLTGLIKGKWDYKHQAGEAESKVSKLEAEYQKVVQKLNAIILVLQK